MADRRRPRPTPAGRGRRPIGLPLLVVASLALAILLRTFVVQAYSIPSASMEPTLQVGDRVVVSKLAHLLRDPVRGEVVVFTEQVEGADDERGAIAGGLSGLARDLGFGSGEERDFIKRIIGLPGETVELRDGVVLIDGEVLEEPPGSLTPGDRADFGPVVVAEDSYFVLGDNRPNSADSRYGLGQVHRDQIVGRAVAAVWPPSTARSLPVGDYGEGG